MIVKFRRSGDAFDYPPRGHVKVAVFVGPDVDHLALAGNIALRADEWSQFQTAAAFVEPLPVPLASVMRQLPDGSNVPFIEFLADVDR